MTQATAGPVIITAAIVGGELSREDTPYLPLTPAEIGEEAARCREAGAAMVHLHARDARGEPTQDREVFAAIFREVRARSDIIVQASTGGSVGMTIAARLQPLELDPEMATLTAGSVNFGDGIFENAWPMMTATAQRMAARGVVPEIEIFDAGMIDNAKRLMREGLIPERAHFDFVLGVPGGLAADEQALDFLVGRLPAGCSYSVAGVGRFQLPMAVASMRRGGHVRTGLEDNIYAAKGVLAKGSFELVGMVVQEARALGREPASPETARALLGLAKRGGA